MKEWLETNGVGGYASSTVCGANTRRYHGLLVAAVKPPVGRVVVLSKLDDQFASNIFPGSSRIIEPSFRRDIFPVFAYPSLRKTIAAIHGENTTVIVYESTTAMTLELRPFIANRDYHSLAAAHEMKPGTFDNDVYSLDMLHLLIPRAAFSPAPDWWYRFEYPIEKERGLDFHEDLFTPGTFRVDLEPNTPLAIIASTENPRGRDGLALLARERRRRERMIEKSPVDRRLTLAADQFIVRRGEARSVIAGYHWFTDWGRDAMIALPGLCLATHRYEDARLILRAFADSISEGMLPNRFPDAGEEPEYNTVDATLWFFIAVKKYADATGDQSFAPVLRDIIAWHVRGTRYNIREDEDGLLFAGAAGVQLTWMDVKIGDEVVTQRYGKPVEVNALWYNALMIAGETAKASRTRASFREKFWNGEAGCLYDVVTGDVRDATIRPNQIFALSLPYPLIDDVQAESVLRVIEERLLTPMGLRTLDPADPRFAPVYRGGVAERDRAYHQGTVWPWLIGPYITALVRVRGDKAAARRAFESVASNLDEACVGSISEICDATEPFAPRGAVAQAWSVGELARVLAEDLK